MPKGKGKWHTAEQVVAILRDAFGGKTVTQTCSTYTISEQRCSRLSAGECELLRAPGLPPDRV